MLIAERIRQRASQPLTLGNSEASVTVSVGIAVLSDPTDLMVTPDSAIRDADTAMYRAKERGGARSELFDASSHDSASRRGELEAALRDANPELAAARPLPAPRVARRRDRAGRF